jgi:transposase
MVSRQTDTATTETRVYKYGLIPIGYPSEESIAELWRANNLWNKLVEIHYNSRETYEKERCNAHPPYAKMTKKLAAINEKIEKALGEKRLARTKAQTINPSHPLIKKANVIVEELKEKRKILYNELKPIRDEADTRINKRSLNYNFKKSINEAVKVGNTGGLYSKTANAILDNFKTARERTFKTGGRLKFHRFDGTGFYAFRFRRGNAKTDGEYFEEMFEGNKKTDRRFVFTDRDDSHKKPRLRLRATLAGGAKRITKIKHEFDLIYHRPIPEGSQIQNGKITRTRIGDRFKYHVVLTVKQPKRKPQDVPQDSAIGIDIGFRRAEDNIQVAAINFSASSEPPQPVFLPKKMVAGMQHVIELQALLFQTATELGKITKPILLKKPLPETHKKYHLWKSLTQYPDSGTLSYETVYKTARCLKIEPNFLPPQVAKLILNWWATYSRKYRELHNLRTKQLLNRKHFYRQVAVDLVVKKQLIVLEKINLTVFAEVKNKDNVLSRKARAQRILAAPSELRTAIINAAKREGIPIMDVPPHYTSKRCGACQVVNKTLKQEKTWKCPSCGTVHDRDENAAKNIAELGKSYFTEGRRRIMG